MTPRLKNILAQSIGIIVAAGLAYLALRHVDFSGMWDALRQADYWWLIPLMAGTLLAHFLRAWRWRMFIDALPESQKVGDAKRVSLWLAFSSVMIGYMINTFAPRLGEFARAANVSSQAKWRFSSVFGTVVVERVLDMATLVLILAGVGIVIAGSDAAEAIFFGPLRTRVVHLGLGAVVIAILGIAAIVFVLVWLPSALRKRHSTSTGLLARLAPLIDSFREGFLTLFRSEKRIGIALTTVVMWFCYWLMIYVPLIMLRMHSAYHLGPQAAFVLLGTGSLGFVVPAPGGIGSYHYFVIQTLVQLYNVPYDAAAGFAVLTHTAQLVLFGVVGVGCLLAQGSSFSSMMQAARRARDEAKETRTPSSDSEGYIQT